MKKIRKWLQTIRQDILNGRYLDHYLTWLAVMVTIVIFLVDFLDIEENHPGITSSAILIVLSLVSFSIMQDRRQKDGQPAFISSNDEKTSDCICEYIENNKVRHARLIQYSGIYATRVIKRLLEKGATVELLLQHPDAVSKSPGFKNIQLSKMTTFYQQYETDFLNNKNLRFKYYKEPRPLSGE